MAKQKKPIARKRSSATSKTKSALVMSVFAPKNEQWAALHAEIKDRDGKVVLNIKQAELEEEVYSLCSLAAFLEQVARKLRDA
jgi:hypothetical protein